MLVLLTQLMSWLDVVFCMPDVPISTPRSTLALLLDPDLESVVFPLGLQDIHVVWRVQILFVPAIGAKQLGSCRREYSPLLRNST